MRNSYLTLLSTLVFAVAGTATAQQADEKDVYEIEYHVMSGDNHIESGFGNWAPALPAPSSQTMMVNGEKVNLKYSMLSGGDGVNMSFYITEDDRLWGIFTSSQCGTAIVDEQWMGKNFNLQKSFSKRCQLRLSITKR
ncbi:hypothetical protein [Idiomarina abyssalis]|uniref:Uncharacterized protein n=1 Tax=Idiomarina abyssalis TaxID=86102 RepID=A0A8I1GF00_9GAMM|nr:hypothetical protein [Idiomarina abyssalis]MBJ7265513.1 hypothetical protein [Idiomarina abyssalis]MBJ7316813.1 hypothetical protein [Idiomarina abyssalis]